MRLPTVHDGRSPLLQRPENQVRSVRGHVQVPCTGLLAGAPHTSKGQGAKGTAATTAARHQMSQCWMTTMPSSLRPRDHLGRRKDRLCSASFRLCSHRANGLANAQ